jgi:signal transduction histidine kinase
MKLFSRLYRLNLGVTIAIFILSGLSFYFLLSYVVIEQFDESLQIERTEIERHVLTYKQLPQIMPVKDMVIVFENANGFMPSSFKNEIAYDTVGRDHADFRKLEFSVLAARQWYRVTVGKSMENTEHLIHSIIAISIVAILLILTISSVVNRALLKKLWQPFYTGLQLMKHYEVGKQKPIEFSTADIDEFNEMQIVLKQATHKADKDFLALKEFTENASHEMQTPLAVLRSKLDLVIQDDQMTAVHSDNFRAMYKVLTQIGNDQFLDKRMISIKDLVEERIAGFEEIFKENALSVMCEMDWDFKVSMNPDLAGILMNNLFSNAVKHNIRGGSVQVKIFSPRKFVISNSGRSVELDNSKLFTRFYKSVPDGSTTGLGLSIVREICDVSNCKISYQFDKENHSFLVEWL